MRIKCSNVQSGREEMLNTCQSPQLTTCAARFQREKSKRSTTCPHRGERAVLRMDVQPAEEVGECLPIGPTPPSNPGPSCSPQKTPVLLCPGCDPKESLQEGTHLAQHTQPCSALCRFVFQFSLMSLLLDPDPGECADRPGAPRPAGPVLGRRKGGPCV